MLDRIRIRNFKAFEDQSLKFRAMTVLTGLNSVGKSSVIQALLLTQSERRPNGEVLLNGPFGLALGEAADVLYEEAEEQTISIELVTRGEPRVFAFRVPAGRSSTLEAVQALADDPSNMALGDEAFMYLGAERLGPR